jgi:hypothetical protein
MARMQEMLRVNIHQNLQIVIHIATDVFRPVKSIEMFESFKTFAGEHHTLRTIVCVLTMPNRPTLHVCVVGIPTVSVMTDDG